MSVAAEGGASATSPSSKHPSRRLQRRAATHTCAAVRTRLLDTLAAIPRFAPTMDTLSAMWDSHDDGGRGYVAESPQNGRRPVRGPGAAVEGADTERCVTPLGFGGSFRFRGHPQMVTVTVTAFFQSTHPTTCSSRATTTSIHPRRPNLPRAERSACWWLHLTAKHCTPRTTQRQRLTCTGRTTVSVQGHKPGISVRRGRFPTDAPPISPGSRQAEKPHRGGSWRRRAAYGRPFIGAAARRSRSPRWRGGWHPLPPGGCKRVPGSRRGGCWGSEW